MGEVHGAEPGTGDHRDHHETGVAHAFEDRGPLVLQTQDHRDQQHRPQHDDQEAAYLHVAQVEPRLALEPDPVVHAEVDGGE